MSGSSSNRPHRTVKDRVGFPGSLPQLHVPDGVSYEKYNLNREQLGILMGRFMTSRLRAMYQAFNGDLTMALVLGEIATRNIDHMYSDRLDELTHEHAHHHFEPCNALSIAETTGIPRETVRRKIAKLVDLGWVEKTRDELYVVSPRVGDAFAAFDDSQVNDVLHMGHQIEEILKTTQDVPA